MIWFALSGLRVWYWVLLVTLICLACCKESSALWKTQEQQSPRAIEMLKPEEEARLRAIIYKDGATTTIAPQGPDAGHVIVIIPKLFEELHKKKRIAALKLLLEIVKGARPEDFLSAAAIATALEDNPRAAVVYVHLKEGDVDEVDVRTGKSLRTRVSAWLAKRMSDDIGTKNDKAKDTGK
jgi:hypothetical protein